MIASVVTLADVPGMVALWRMSRVALALGVAAFRKGYHDVNRHPEGRRIPGLLVVRFDAPLFFANAPRFAEFVHEALRDTGGIRWVVVAAEPITDVDTTAAEELTQVDDDLQRRGVRLVWAEMKGPVKDRPARCGLERRFEGRH